MVKDCGRCRGKKKSSYVSKHPNHWSTRALQTLLKKAEVIGLDFLGLYTQ